MEKQTKICGGGVHKKLKYVMGGARLEICGVGSHRWKKLSPCSIDGSSNMKEIPVEHIEICHIYHERNLLPRGYEFLSWYICHN